jgi:hypothetical protein
MTDHEYIRRLEDVVQWVWSHDDDDWHEMPEEIKETMIRVAGLRAIKAMNQR